MLLNKYFRGLFLSLITSASIAGMDFGWGTDHSKPSEPTTNPKDVLWMIGEIKKGDFERFRSFVLSHMDTYTESSRSVYLSSAGGNILEALKMAQLLKQMYATAYVPSNEKCASACFFLYVGGVRRYASFNDTLGVHRAYFEREYFAKLTPAQAEAKQAELTGLLERFLVANSVPRSIMENITRTSSKDIHWLTRAEIDSIGKYPPWYEEVLIAKCGYKGEEHGRQLFWAALKAGKTQEWFDEIDRVSACEDKFVQTELKRTLRGHLEGTDPGEKSPPVKKI